MKHPFSLSPKYQAITTACEMLLERMAKSKNRRDKAVAELARDLVGLASRAMNQEDYLLLMHTMSGLLYQQGEFSHAIESPAIVAICDCLHGE